MAFTDADRRKAVLIRKRNARLRKEQLIASAAIPLPPGSSKAQVKITAAKRVDYDLIARIIVAVVKAL